MRRTRLDPGLFQSEQVAVVDCSGMKFSRCLLDLPCGVLRIEIDRCVVGTDSRGIVKALEAGINYSFHRHSPSPRRLFALVLGESAKGLLRRNLLAQRRHQPVITGVRLECDAHRKAILANTTRVHLPTQHLLRVGQNDCALGDAATQSTLQIA